MSALLTNRRILFASAKKSSLLSGLISYWTFDEASGTVFDSVGTNHLTATNNPVAGTGKVGTAAAAARTFVSASSQSMAAAVPVVDISNTCFFAGWFLWNGSFTLADVFDIWSNTGNQRGLTFEVSSASSVKFYSSQNGTATGLSVTYGGAALVAGTWYFICCWYDKTNATINIRINNGTIYSTGSVAGVFPSSSPLTFGKLGSANYFNGSIDEFGVWTRVLTTAEQTTLYNAGAGRTAPFPGT